MPNTLTTISGDTFDLLARRQYGDEKLAMLLVEANPAHAATVVFPAGIELTAPEKPTAYVAAASLPPWRRT